MLQVPLWVLIVIGGLSTLLILYKGIKLAKDTNLIKESRTDNSDDTCYSFSKSQILFWTLIVIPCFIWNWLLVQFPSAWPTLNEDALILLGISSATLLASQGLGGLKSDDKEPNSKSNLVSTGTSSEIYFPATMGLIRSHDSSN